MTAEDNNSKSFGLNAAIGFLSLLLALLVFGLFTRIVYPKIENKRTQKDQQLISDVIQLEVLNGSGVPGLDDSATSTLRKNGFDVVKTGNFNKFDMTKDGVIGRPNKSDKDGQD